ncbi:hypothetical protein WJX73_005933 [Symbiochloris irregularis]|uniref:Exonuclease domain-containing protein n=1 Tax=Symbiochloris irregularis TaxID=706552 RepID=A0AAW1PIT2_9CHLO
MAQSTDPEELEDGEIEEAEETTPRESVEDPEPDEKTDTHSIDPAKAIKPRDKSRVSAPSVLERVYGEEGRASVRLERCKVPRLSEVQNLLLWVLAEGTSPVWAFVKNKPLIHQVVMVAVPGLDYFTYNQAELPNLKKYFGNPITTSTLNGFVRQPRSVGELFTVPLSRKRKHYLDELGQGISSKDEPPNKKAKRSDKPEPRKTDPFPPSHYCMTRKQIAERKFPACMRGDASEGEDDYPCTQPSGAAEGDAAWERMVAMDCEMVITSEGYELARMSLTNEAGQLLLDTLVLPEHNVTDHNTRYSGITAAMLEPITTTLADAQRMFMEVVSAETLLVGHALENDLSALKLAHYRLLDTSVLFPHPRGPPMRSKLSYLAERHLKRLIQQGSHDSVVDAQASMDLVKLKVHNGPAFGVPAVKDSAGDRLLQVLTAVGVRCSVVDHQDVLNRHVTGNANALLCFSDKECVAKAVREIGSQGIGFVWTQLRELNAYHEKAAVLQSMVPYKLAKTSQEEILQRMDLQLGKLYEAAAPNTMFIVPTCQGNTAVVRLMQERKWRADKKLDGLPKWTTECESLLVKASARANKALCFVVVKQ